MSSSASLILGQTQVQILKLVETSKIIQAGIGDVGVAKEPILGVASVP